jgi:hypothetical protein
MLDGLGMRDHRIIDDVLAAASAVAIDADTPANEVEQAEARWSLARSKCGDRWQPTHEQEFMAFRAQLAATVAQRARNQCAAAGEAAAQLLNQNGESGERTDLEAIRDLLAERCGGAKNASNVLAGFTARANQLRRARAQAEKAEAAAKRRRARGGGGADLVVAELVVLAVAGGRGPEARHRRPQLVAVANGRRVGRVEASNADG